MASFKKNRKGNIFLEVTIIVVVLFVLAIFFPLFGNIYFELNDEIQQDNQISARAKAIPQHYEDNYWAIWNWGFFAIFFGYTLGALIAAYFIESSPVFIIIAIILLPILVLVSMELSNAYDDYITEFPSQDTGMPYISFIWSIMPYYIVTLISSLAIIMYSKKT